MEIIKRENGSYIIASDGKNHLISIVCGTSALFEVIIRLSDEQKSEILNDKVRLQEILDKVRLNPGMV